MGEDLPPITWHSLVTQSDVGSVWSLVAVVLLAGYLVGLAVGRARAATTGVAGSPAGLAPGSTPGQTAGLSKEPGPWRVTAFVAGVVLLFVAICSAVGVYAQSVFYLHMVQHLLLITVVPALLVLGHPLSVLDRAVGGGRVERVLASWPVALITHPVVGFVIYAVVVVGTHLTGFMNQMMSTPGLVSGEHLLYLVGGYLYLLPLLGEEPIRWHPPALMRLGLLIAGMVPDTVVGIVLLQTTGNPFPAMLSADHAWAPDPTADVQAGGGLMWALGDGLMMVLAVGVVIALLTSSLRPADQRTTEQRSPAGAWLEGVRRSTLQAHAATAGQTGLADDVDVDEDDSALAAYNAMLRRMGGREES